MRLLIVGAGRAGQSFATALGEDHDVALVHHDELPATTDVDLVLLCVPDHAIDETARRLSVGPDTVVAHVAGSASLDVLAHHRRIGSLHPLLTMPDGSTGARRLRGGVFAVEGDELLVDVVASLGGRVIAVPAQRRTLYHATATSAANHLVALLGHVQVLAEDAGLELRDFLPLARQALDDVTALGPARALTGPSSRGDVATMDAHLAAIAVAERSTYAALSQRARRVAGESTVARCSD